MRSPRAALARHAAATVARVADELAGAAIIGPLPSVTNWVYLVRSPDGQRLVAKYGMLGHSRPTVEKAVRADGLRHVLDRQERYLGGTTRLALECEVLHRVEPMAGRWFSTPVGLLRGVLLLGWVPGTSLGEMLPGLPPDRLASSLQATLTAAWEVHSLGASSETRHALADVSPAMLLSDVATTYARKFAPGTPHRAMAESAGWSSERLDVLSAALASTGSGRSPALVIGDLKPEHVVLGDGGGVRFIDPSPHLADPEVDLARLAARTALQVRGRRDVVEVATAVADIVPSGTEGAVSHRRLALLMVADVLNIVTTCASFDRRSLRRQTPHVRLTAKDADELLATCAVVAAASVDDPDEELAADTCSQLVAALVGATATTSPVARRRRRGVA